MERGRFPILKAVSILFYIGGGISLGLAVLMALAAMSAPPQRPNTFPTQTILQFGSLFSALIVASSGVGLIVAGEWMRLALSIEDRLFSLQESEQETQRLLRQMNPEAASKQATSAMLLVRDELQQARFSMERTANATEVLAGTVKHRAGK